MFRSLFRKLSRGLTPWPSPARRLPPGMEDLEKRILLRAAVPHRPWRPAESDVPGKSAFETFANGAGI